MSPVGFQTLGGLGSELSALTLRTKSRELWCPGLCTEVGLGSMGATRFGADGFSKVVEDFLGVLSPSLTGALRHFLGSVRAGEAEGGRGDGKGVLGRSLADITVSPSISFQFRNHDKWPHVLHPCSGWRGRGFQGTDLA